MTNSIGTRSTSVLGTATSILTSTRDAFKAMADAATNASAESPAATAETATSKGRRGLVLDRYA